MKRKENTKLFFLTLKVFNPKIKKYQTLITIEIIYFILIRYFIVNINTVDDEYIITYYESSLMKKKSELQLQNLIHLFHLFLPRTMCKRIYLNSYNL